MSQRETQPVQNIHDANQDAPPARPNFWEHLRAWLTPRRVIFLVLLIVFIWLGTTLEKLEGFR